MLHKFRRWNIAYISMPYCFTLVFVAASMTRKCVFITYINRVKMKRKFKKIWRGKFVNTAGHHWRSRYATGSEALYFSLQHSCEIPGGAHGYQSLAYCSKSFTQRDPSQIKFVMNSFHPVRQRGIYAEALHCIRRCRHPLSAPAVNASLTFKCSGAEDESKHFECLTNFEEKYLDMVALAEIQLENSKVEMRKKIHVI